MKHRIIRFVYTREVNVCGWPSSRMRGVWWLYELRITELRRDLADNLMATYEAVQAWLAAQEPTVTLIGFKSKV